MWSTPITWPSSSPPSAPSKSGGNYQTRITSATASGAYAFIDRSWRHYAGLAGVDTAAYPSAWMAPPADQDATATVYVNEILAEHGGRIDVIPIAWYLPSAIGNDAKMDVVPRWVPTPSHHANTRPSGWPTTNVSWPVPGSPATSPSASPSPPRPRSVAKTPARTAPRQLRPPSPSHPAAVSEGPSRRSAVTGHCPARATSSTMIPAPSTGPTTTTPPGTG